MFTGLADQFLRGKTHKLFTDKLSIVPELSETGKIIILDLPVKEYGESGRLAQILFKYLWQKAIERRSVKESPRPVFLWADEAQNFCASYDMQFSGDGTEREGLHRLSDPEPTELLRRIRKRRQGQAGKRTHF